MMSESSSEYQELSAYGVMVSYSQKYVLISGIICAWYDGQLQQNIILRIAHGVMVNYSKILFANYVLLYLVEIFTLSTA